MVQEPGERGHEDEPDDEGTTVEPLANHEVARVGGQVRDAEENGTQREHLEGHGRGEREGEGDGECAEERGAQRPVAKPPAEPRGERAQRRTPERVEDCEGQRDLRARGGHRSECIAGVGLRVERRGGSVVGFVIAVAWPTMTTRAGLIPLTFSVVTMLSITGRGDALPSPTRPEWHDPPPPMPSPPEVAAVLAIGSVGALLVARANQRRALRPSNHG